MLKLRYSSSFLLLLFVFSSCSLKKTLTVENKNSISREDELLSIKRSFIEEKTGALSPEKFIVLKAGQKEYPVQFIDNDKDGKWDEALTLLSLAANERKDLQVSVTSRLNSVGSIRANVRHRRKNSDNTFGASLLKDSIPAGQQPTDFKKTPLPPFLTEGPAWENDKLGFRLYYDIRNGKDIWGKTTDKMMMDTVGTPAMGNYHNKAAWGMDVLKAGASLGAGGLALSVPYNGKDTLVRLGGVNMGEVIFEQLADGPLMGRFKLTYPAWKVLPELSPVKLTEEISIWGGKYFYESTVNVANAPAGSKIVTGIVNLKSKSCSVINDADARVLYTFDKQSENNDELGMAVLASKNNFHSSAATSNTEGDIRNTYIVSLSPLKNASFRFYAAWSKSDPRFTTESGFKKFLKTESSNFSSPVVIRWKSK